MKAIFFFAILVSEPAMGAPNTYELTLDLTIPAHNITSAPRLTVEEGKSVSIFDGNSFIEVVASEEKNNGIKMLFAVGTIDKDGKRKTLGEPAIVARENEAAQLSISENKGTRPDITLGVTVKRMRD